MYKRHSKRLSERVSAGEKAVPKNRETRRLRQTIISLKINEYW